MTVAVRAVSVGEAVPRRNFNGAVHSVFENAANIQGAGEGLLLTVLGSGNADLPQGIRLDSHHSLGFDGMSVGARAICREGLLALGEGLIIDLRPASTWHCRLNSLEADLADPTVLLAWSQAWDALRERRAGLGSAMVTARESDETPAHRTAIDRRLNETMREVVAATGKHDRAGIAAVRDLVGLGTGLTPSGDDILTGFLAGLYCTVRGRPERGGLLEAVAGLVNLCASRTNDIARTYLCLAARGQISRRLVDLAATICEGAGPARVSAAAGAAMQVGHTSGMESVNGLLLGLAAWDGAEQLTLESCCEE